MHVNGEIRSRHEAWSAGQIVGAKPPLTHIWHYACGYTRRYGHLADEWASLIGLNPADCGAHSRRRTKISLLYKRIRNLRACQLLLDHTEFGIENTVRYLEIEVDGPLGLSEQTES